MALSQERARAEPDPTPGRRATVTRRAMLRRAFAITGVLVRHGLGWLAEWTRPWRLLRVPPARRGHAAPAGRRTAAQHLRMALADLGPTFVKLGQLLSSRADLLPPAFQAELALLQDAAPPEAPGTVEAVIEAELGRPVDEVFRHFEAAPFAAASIGQAHSATLADGTPVVVKVRRPAALARIEVDLAVLEAAAALAARCLATARRLDVRGLAGEFARTLRAELDYEVEARNAERFAANLAAVPGVHVPAVHREASTGRVITLERITGIKVSDLDALDRAGVDRRQLARAVVDVVLTMVFEHGFFHADPHAGNLFVEPDGRLGLVDFGMVGALDATTRRHLVHLFVATATGDAASLADELLALGTATGPVDRGSLTDDLAGVLRDATRVPLGERRLGPLLQAELAIVRRHALRLPPELALLAKTAAMTEGLAGMIDPDFVSAAAFAPYAARLVGPAAGAPDGDRGQRPPAGADRRSSAPG